LGFTLENNYIVGPLQIRQVRSRVDDCTVTTSVLKNINHCYRPVTEELQDTKAFGPAHQYKYSGRLELTTQASGQLKSPYSANGYDVNLPKNATGARELLASMKKNRWVDHQTRAVVIQWMVYNPTADMFLNNQILFEFPAFGGVLSFSKFVSLQPLRYEGERIMSLILEVIVVLIVLTAIYREFTLWKDVYAKSFTAYATFVTKDDPHRIMDWCNYLMSICIFALRMEEWQASAELVYDSKKDQLQGFFEVYDLYQWDIFLQAINCSQMWIKSFKYVNTFHTPSVFNEVYRKSVSDLMMFTMMFVTTAGVFAQAGMIFFGARSARFVNITDSLYTLFDMLTGKISAFELNEILPGWGTAFYIVYMFSQIYCFLNYVFGIFNYAILITFYSSKPEHFFGFHVREFVRVRSIVLASRLQWMKFWERGANNRKPLSEAQLEKKKRDLELQLEPHELFVTDVELFSTRVELRHLRLLLGQDAVTAVIQDVDKFGTCTFDKSQIKDVMEHVFSQVLSNDSLRHIRSFELHEWPLTINPLIFGKLDRLQCDSRSTKYPEKFFRSMEADLMKTKNSEAPRMETISMNFDSNQENSDHENPEAF